MRVLIVGCGYVGVALGTELARAGHEVSGLRRSSVHLDELIAAGIRPLSADITSPDSLGRIVPGWDWVVSCASSSRGTADDYRAVYLEGTKNLLHWLATSPPQKFACTSSTSVYGQSDGSWVNESSPTEPEAETARVLLGTEKLLLAAAEPAPGRKPFPAVVLRVSGIYGPSRRYWLEQFLQKKFLPQGPDRFLNMVHRDDVSGAIIAALQHGTPGEIYNVTDDEPVTRSDFVRWLFEQTGIPQAAAQPATEAQTRRQQKGGSTNKRIRNDKLKQELGYNLRYPTFREGYAPEIKARMNHDLE